MVVDSRWVTGKASVLQKFWSDRNKKFKIWYQQIQMIDRLAQKNMESFVGNDPRAALNLLVGILDQPVPHRIRPEELENTQVAPAAELSRNFDYIWREVRDRYRQRGRYWMRDLVTFILSTGWYSAFSVISLDGSTCLAEIWNPATVYPSWDDVLVECAHVFVLTESQAKRLAARNKWNVSRLADKNTCVDYWWLDDGGKVHDSIVLTDQLVKPDTLESKFSRIPIFTSPVGGLPDTGEIISDKPNVWKGEIGQSYIVTNENIYNYFNKWWTFLLQILRDNAQPRTYEKTASSKNIVKPEEWDRRGAHFKMGIQDDIGYIAPPPIPVEIRSSQLDMEAMMQQGGPPRSLFGDVSQGMTNYVMSQVVASTNNAAKAFHQGIADCISDIDNFWIELMQNYGYKPYEKAIPSGLPDKFKLSADYELRIPGDLANRATSSRMLNPEFTLSEERIMEWNFPEIKNPSEEIARRDAGRARRDPIFAQLSLVSALRQEANLLREAKDNESAELYEKAADIKEQQIMGAGQEQQRRSQGRAAPGVRPEVIPPQEVAAEATTTREEA